MTPLQREILLVANDTVSGSIDLLERLINAIEASNDAPLSDDEVKSLKNLLESKKHFAVLTHFINELLSSNRKDVRQFTSAYRIYWHEFNKKIISRAIASLHGKRKYLLHSHSETVVNFFDKLKDRHSNAIVWQTTSMPGGEGNIQAQRLRRFGFITNLVSDKPDDALFEEIEVLLCGADVIGKKSFINKSGTFYLSEKTFQRGKQVVVLADRRKVLEDPVQFSTIKNSMGDLFEETPLSFVSNLITNDQ